MRDSFLWIPPTLRFIVEFTTWIWLLLYNWLLLFPSLLGLGLLNFPGDKKAHGEKNLGIEVDGIVRIFVEILSAVLGIFAAWQLFNSLGFAFQIIITVGSFYLDYDRWKWMLGKREIPDYVLFVHKKR